jgi:hypothetical protein
MTLSGVAVKCWCDVRFCASLTVLSGSVRIWVCVCVCVFVCVCLCALS